jgi:hypothetical protein
VSEVVREVVTAMHYDYASSTGKGKYQVVQIYTSFLILLPIALNCKVLSDPRPRKLVLLLAVPSSVINSRRSVKDAEKNPYSGH